MHCASWPISADCACRKAGHRGPTIIRIRMSFIARYVYTYEEFVFVTEVTAVQQNDSDKTKTQIIKRRIKKNK